MSSKDDVLIVEDSPAIGMLLKSYLEKLGYTQVHTCDTGSAAITTFNDLVSQNKQPIVLLDYMPLSPFDCSMASANFVIRKFLSNFCN